MYGERVCTRNPSPGERWAWWPWLSSTLCPVEGKIKVTWSLSLGHPGTLGMYGSPTSTWCTRTLISKDPAPPLQPLKTAYLNMPVLPLNKSASFCSFHVPPMVSPSIATHLPTTLTHSAGSTDLLSQGGTENSSNTAVPRKALSLFQEDHWLAHLFLLQPRTLREGLKRKTFQRRTKH